MIALGKAVMGMPLRTRLTALYAGAFFVAGGLLVVAMYGLVALNLEREPSIAFSVEPPPQVSAEVPPTESLIFPNDTLVNRISAAEEQRRSDTLTTLLWQSLIALGVVGVSSTVLGYMLAGRALRPLSQVTATARRVAERSLHERIALDGPPDEIKELADTFDEMLERLDRAFAGQQQFVGNASHELRTPLAVERTLLEVAMSDPVASDDLKRVGTTLLATNERTEQLIDGLLTLARSQHEVGERTRADLRDMVAGALDTTDAELAVSGVTAHQELHSAPVCGDIALLERLVLNLIQNAVRHNVAGGTMWIATNSVDRNGVLTVANTGALIRPHEVARLFEPFARLSQQRVGKSHGLGLSIVRAVARAHGGVVTAVPRPGGGLVVTTRLPGA